MAWHDEYPHKVCASVLLLDGKVECWKIGYPAKTEIHNWSTYWKMDRLKDYTIQTKCFKVRNPQEHHLAFVERGPNWLDQFEYAEDYRGGGWREGDVRKDTTANSERIPF